MEAAIRAGEEAADNDFKLKFEQAQKELADVRNELDAAAEAQKAAEDKIQKATDKIIKEVDAITAEKEKELMGV